MIAKKLKKVFENKKKSSNKNISCLKKEVCYNNLMLKTISYSICLLAPVVNKIKKDKNYKVKQSDDVFSELNNKLVISNVLKEVFKDQNIEVKKEDKEYRQGEQIYKSNNGYTFSFNAPVEIDISYKDKDINENECKIVNNIKNIVNNLIKSIWPKEQSEPVVSKIGVEYKYECEYKDKKPKDIIKQLLSSQDEGLEDGIIAVQYKKDDKTTLNVTATINDDNKDLMDCKAFIRTNIESLKDVDNVLNTNTDDAQYIIGKLEALKLIEQ